MLKLEKIGIEKIYALFLLTIFGWATIALLIMNDFLSKQEQYGELINVSGMQRMLSQKILRTSHLAVEFNDEQERKRFDVALQKMQKNHEYLIKNIPSEKIRSLYYGSSYRINEKTIYFIDNLKTLVENKRLKDLRKIDINDEFLTDLDLVVRSIKNEYEENFKKYLFMEIIIWVFAVGTIALEAFYLVIPTIKSIQEAKKMAESASIGKSEFLSVMSHEMRTPLNGIIALVDLLRMKEFDPQTDKYLKVIFESAYALEHIITQVLEYSRMAASEFQTDNAPFDLKYTIVNTVDQFTNLASSKEIQYFHYIGDFPAHLNGDSLQLKQIMENLISNSIKFTPQKGTVKVKATYDLVSHIFRFAVKDTGIGISKEKIKIIFEPFKQLDSSNTRKYGGIGLGLAIVKSLVYTMGGKLQIESQENVGTTIIVEIPMKFEKS